MSRRDFRVSVAVGCVLLAVLIVYLLVVPGSSKNDQVATDGTPGETTVAKPTDSAPTINVTSGTPTAPTPAPRASVGVKPEIAVKDPFASPRIENDTPKTKTDPAPATPDTDWARLLEGAPVLRSETPAPPSAFKPTNAPPTTAPATPTQTVVPPITRTPADSATPRTDAKSPATQPAGTVTHVIQAGETLSSISKRYYGVETLWSLIAKANPSINPDRVRAGQSLTIPPLASAPSSASSKSNENDRAFDSARQYAVQPGESLYKISVKLWGDARHVDALYELNKSKIGSDPARVKAGMILNLPQAPSASASR